MAAAEYVQSSVSVDTFLVDDGCTDGTSDAVRSDFPQVKIIAGTGNLFWCGGMRLAWAHAGAGNYDAYLWLNDDVVLDDDAIDRLLIPFHEGQRADGAVIVVGTTRNEGVGPAMLSASYGGMGANGVMQPSREARPIKLFNGNIVLVSRAAFQCLGNLSTAYTHGLGDIDYGIRANRAGVPALLAADTHGSCAANKLARWRQHDLSLWRRLYELHRPTGCPPWQLARLLWSDGRWWFPWSVAKLYWQACFPSRRTGAS
jgi:GT2 family glycosyltransferase